jgi:hypothetical protein
MGHAQSRADRPKEAVISSKTLFGVLPVRQAERGTWTHVQNLWHFATLPDCWNCHPLPKGMPNRWNL